MKRTYSFYMMLFLFFLFGFLIVFAFLSYLAGTNGGLEAFTTKNTNYKYIPNKTIPNTFKAFNINDALQETIYMIDFVKTDNQLMASAPDPSTASNPDMASPEEYKTPVNTLNTYKFYSDLETSVDDKLEVIYGKYFDPRSYPDKMAKPIEYENFKQKWLELVKPHSELLGKIDYFAVATDASPSKKYAPNDFSLYIFEYVSNYTATQTQTEKVKKFFYNVIRPIHLHRSLTDYYLANFEKTNSRDEALFVMNTSKELIGKLTTDVFLINPKGVVYLFEEEAQQAESKTKGFLADTLLLFQCGSIVKNLVVLLDDVSTKKKNSVLKMDIGKFYSGFPAFLKKTYPDAYKNKEPLVNFIAVNLPTLPQN